MKRKKTTLKYWYFYTHAVQINEPAVCLSVLSVCRSDGFSGDGRVWGQADGLCCVGHDGHRVWRVSGKTPLNHDVTHLRDEL